MSQRSHQYQLLGDGPGPGLKISFKKFAFATVMLPFSAFLSCVLLSLYLHYEESTATHCRVRNHLPSISAAIGGFIPQRYIWRIAIAFHTAPRFLVGAMYYNYYLHYFGKSGAFVTVVRLTFGLYIIENISLIVMSYVSSIENKDVHELGFIFFTAASLLHMFFTVWLFKALKESDRIWGAFSRKLKTILMIVNISALAIALYCYFRHNQYCEPLVYTFFAFFEYIFVVSNMAFHMTAYLDFHEYKFEVCPIQFQKNIGIPF